MNKLKYLISHAKSYGFIFPSSEIYDGLKSVYDYGQHGVMLKNNIKEYWWKYMVQLNENIVGIDSAIIMHPNTWKASGHVDYFNDYYIDNKDSKSRYRIDDLFEKYLENIQLKIDSIIYKANKLLGKKFNKENFITTNKDILKYLSLKKDIINKVNYYLLNNDLNNIKNIIDNLNISDPKTGSKNWTNIRKYNLMFSSKIGAIEDNSLNIYLRPETAQGIFINYYNVQKTSRLKIPFGIAQIGKSFRNEITARQFIFRMREFEQMEMQFFIEPNTSTKWYDFWKKSRLKWHLLLGLGSDKYRFKIHKNLSHYNKAATDIEFLFPFGFKELEGIHFRSDFDLKNHEKFSKKKLRYFDTKKNISYIPYVIETSLGLDRMFLSILSYSFVNEILKNGKKRVYLKIPPILAPIKAGIFPLLKNNELSELAKKIFNNLKVSHQLIYDDNNSIGKRYRRQDAIGTPFCITIDNDSLLNNTVTLRYRDNMEQKRVSIEKLDIIIHNETKIESFFKKKLLFN